MTMQAAAQREGLFLVVEMSLESFAVLDLLLVSIWTAYVPILIIMQC